MLRCLAVLAALTACARGRSDEPAVDASTKDSATQLPSIDAAIDAPKPSGTCTQAFTGTLASYSFAGEPGTQASTVVSTKAAGITAGNVTRAAALTATAGTNSINSSNWPLTAARDITKYYAFTIAPPAGCTLTLTTANIDALSSGTGPVSGQLATSADNYTATQAISTTAAVMVNVGVMDATGMIEVRIYGYAATGTGGTLRLKGTLSIDGQLK